jgi:hypothetical protein
MRSDMALTEIAEDVGRRFPYPVAYPIRGYSHNEQTPELQYRFALDAAQNLIITLGAIGMAWFCHVGYASDQLDRWYRQLLGNDHPRRRKPSPGLALGTWLDVAREAADYARKRGVALSGFSQGFTGLLLDDLDELVRLRNVDAHTLRVSRDPAPHATLRRLDELGAVLGRALRASVFLADLQLVQVLPPTEQEREADVFTERGLHGFNADVNWTDRVGTVSQHAANGEQYASGEILLLADRDTVRLRISPFLMLHEYVPDAETGVRGKGLCWPTRYLPRRGIELGAFDGTGAHYAPGLHTEFERAREETARALAKGGVPSLTPRRVSLPTFGQICQSVRRLVLEKRRTEERSGRPWHGWAHSLFGEEIGAVSTAYGLRLLKLVGGVGARFNAAIIDESFETLLAMRREGGWATRGYPKRVIPKATAWVILAFDEWGRLDQAPDALELLEQDARWGCEAHWCYTITICTVARTLLRVRPFSLRLQELAGVLAESAQPDGELLRWGPRTRWCGKDHSVGEPYPPHATVVHTAHAIETLAGVWEATNGACGLSPSRLRPSADWLIQRIAGWKDESDRIQCNIPHAAGTPQNMELIVGHLTRAWGLMAVLAAGYDQTDESVTAAARDLRARFQTRGGHWVWHERAPIWATFDALYALSRCEEPLD